MRDASIHHVARTDAVRAGARIRHRGAAEEIERRFMIDLPLFSEYATMAVIGGGA